MHMRHAPTAKQNWFSIKNTDHLPDTLGDDGSHNDLYAAPALARDNLKRLHTLIKMLNDPSLTSMEKVIFQRAKCSQGLSKLYPELLTEEVLTGLNQLAAQVDNQIARDWFIGRAILNNAMTVEVSKFLQKLEGDFAALKKWFTYALAVKALNVVGYLLNHFCWDFVKDQEIGDKVCAHFGRTGELDLYPFVFIIQLRQKQPAHYAPKLREHWEMVRTAIVNHKSYLDTLEDSLLICADANLFKKIVDRQIRFYRDSVESFLAIACYNDSINLVLCLKEFRPEHFTPSCCKALLAMQKTKQNLPSDMLQFLIEKGSGGARKAHSPRLFSETEENRANSCVAGAFNLAGHF